MAVSAVPHVEDMPDPDRRDAALQWMLEDILRAEPARLQPTPQEIRVLTCASHGLTNSMIAETLGVTTESVKHHFKGASRRLAAKNRAHAVAIALREHMIA